MEGSSPSTSTANSNGQEENGTSQAKKVDPCDGSLNPICSQCETKESILWTRDSNNKILCRPCSKAIHVSKSMANGNKADDMDKNVSSKSSDTTTKESTENEAPGQPSGPKKGSKKGKMRQGSCQNKQSSVKGKGRRSIFKKCVYKSPASVVMPVTSDAIFYKGFLYQAGDIVSVTDFDGSIYYAQIRGLLQDQYCEKSAAVTWLIPTQQSHRNHFDPATYILGPEEDIPRKLECLTFVCNCPSDYFKLKNYPFTSPRVPAREAAFTWANRGPFLVRPDNS